MIFRCTSIMFNYWWYMWYFWQVPNQSLSCFQVSFTGCFAALELHRGHEPRARAFLHAIPCLNVGACGHAEHRRAAQISQDFKIETHMTLGNVVRPLEFRKVFAMMCNVFSSNEHKPRINQWPFQEPKLEVPTIYKAYVREYPYKIWPYMVQYLHFRILEFPLNKQFTQLWWRLPKRLQRNGGIWLLDATLPGAVYGATYGSS